MEKDFREVVQSWLDGNFDEQTKDQISLPEDDLIREAARMMGYNRLGSVVTELFRKAILCAKGQGRIEIASNGNWILKPSKKG